MQNRNYPGLYVVNYSKALLAFIRDCLGTRELHGQFIAL